MNIKKRTNWLLDKTDLDRTILFAPPLGLLYFVKTREDFKSINIKLLEDRLYLFSIWENSLFLDYPSLEWDLSDIDIEFLNSFSEELFFDKFSKVILFWLQGKWPSFLIKYKLISRNHLTTLSKFNLGSKFFIPNFLELIISSRSDLLLKVNQITPYDYIYLINWWISSGHKEYKRIEWSPSLETLIEWVEIDVLNKKSMFALPGFLYYISRNRIDLQETYFANNDVSGLFDWWLDYGRYEYNGILRLLSQDVSGYNDIPEFLKRIISIRIDLRVEFIPLDQYGYLRIIDWWVAYGYKEYKQINYEDKIESLFSFIKNIKKIRDDLIETPAFLQLIFSKRKDLQKIFTLNTINGRSALLEWWNHNGIYEYPGISILLNNAINKFTKTSNPINDQKFGVNIIGYPLGVLGIGEDIRMASAAFQLAEVLTAVLDIPIPGPKQEDDTLLNLLVNEIKYPISVFCLPPNEMIRLATESHVDLINYSEYNIGAWPWELSIWPKEFDKITEFVDEIWAQSVFVANAFRNITDKPIILMPIAVETPLVKNPSRDRFKLPHKDFLFLLMFDGNSWLSRKNPLAGVHAFLNAFPIKERGVCLVIKTMNLDTKNSYWQEILRLVINDKRIIIINEKMSRQDAIDFLSCCDCYISLHRTEGFGRIIAEAMLLGKPTVTSNFSGNMDFCNEFTSYIIDGKLVPLTRNEYLNGDGQFWFDPDINIATEMLQKVINDSKVCSQIANAGRNFILDNYSLKVVSEKYKQRLIKINKKILNN